jgi:YfiH family protein
MGMRPLNIPDMRNGGFVLREFQGIRYFSCTALENIPNLCHGFSTREGGSGTAEKSLNLNYSAWDSPERVHENRRRFLSALNLENTRLATLHQVHSNRVHIIEENSREWNQSEGDALATTAVDIALAVKSADCLPILIADPVRHAVAAVHSGWRGTLSRILLKTIQAMQEFFGCNPLHLIVAVGPGIRECCFEVGPEVVLLFQKEYAGACLTTPSGTLPGKFFLDLGKALDMQLDLAGVLTENRYDLGECTCCNTDRFFSYRAEGPASGRMMTVIGLKGEADQQSIVNRQS